MQRLTLAALSPYQQRPLAGMFTGYVFNGFKRIMENAKYFAVPLGLCTSVPPCRPSGFTTSDVISHLDLLLALTITDGQRTPCTCGARTRECSCQMLIGGVAMEANVADTLTTALSRGIMRSRCASTGVTRIGMHCSVYDCSDGGPPDLSWPNHLPGIAFLPAHGGRARATSAHWYTSIVQNCCAAKLSSDELIYVLSGDLVGLEVTQQPRAT